MRLIDADELDRAFSNIRWYSDGGLHHWGDRPNWCLMGEEVERLITESPTIDAEPVRRGKWTEHPREREWDVCSCCITGTKRREFGVTDGGKEWVTEYGYKYCPWCGAKMEETWQTK